MTALNPPRPFTVFTVPSRPISMPLPATLDQQLVTLAHDAVRNAGFTPERAATESAGLLTALRFEAEDALAHGIDEAEIVERVTTMARMHRVVATGVGRSTESALPGAPS